MGAPGARSTSGCGPYRQNGRKSQGLRREVKGEWKAKKKKERTRFFKKKRGKKLLLIFRRGTF
jgi:hypothetical protein